MFDWLITFVGLVVAVVAIVVVVVVPDGVVVCLLAFLLVFSLS